MISAVIVNHDGGADLERCLASLEPLGLDPRGGEGLEVIVVDNASSDGSPERVRQRFPTVRLLELGTNAGFGAATNRGAGVARGELLLLLNNDAWLTGGALARLAARLDAEADLAWVTPRLVYPDGRPQTFWAPDVSLLGEAVQKVRNRLEGARWNHGTLVRHLRRWLGPGWLTAACALVRRSAFEAVGGFDEGFFLYFEDADLCLRLRQAGWRLDVEPAAEVVHASVGGTRGDAIEVAYRASQLRYYAKHRPRWERAVLVRFLLARYRWGRGDAAQRAAVMALLRAAAGGHEHAP